VCAAAVQEAEQIPAGPIDVFDGRQIEVERAIPSPRVARAPGSLDLADPQSGQVPLEPQADTIWRGLHGDPQHTLCPMTHRKCDAQRLRPMAVRKYWPGERNAARTRRTTSAAPSPQRQWAACCQQVGTRLPFPWCGPGMVSMCRSSRGTRRTDPGERMTARAATVRECGRR